MEDAVSGRRPSILAKHPPRTAEVITPRIAPAAPAPMYVTEPTLPPLTDLLPYLEAIWETRILTNMGPLHQRLERALEEYLGVKHLSLFNNGTVALLAALKALDLKGEVITTPFSFVATAHSVRWNDLTPVFADIDPVTYNLDPQSVSERITEDTTAIMPVHCYGTPCDVDGFAKLSRETGIPVVYDAAHAFGVRFRGASVALHGDLAVLSLHATKVFNTMEGGAIVSPTAEMKRRVDLLRNFGFTGETSVDSIGINGKMSELHAAVGLAQLPIVDDSIRARERVAARYREALAGVEGITLPPRLPGASQNHSYFPILVGPEYPLSRDALYDRLKKDGVHTRRYFYPLITEFAPYREETHPLLPVAHRVSRQVLCLPIFARMTAEQQERVLRVILQPERE